MLKMLTMLAKKALPDRDVLLPVLAGPFRGARFVSNPQVALRKVFGVYEHELNKWLESVLPKADVVIDVGANDGYFTFGSAMSMRRAGRQVRVIAIEPSDAHVSRLRQARSKNRFSESEITIVQAMAGAADGGGSRSLDSLTAGIGIGERIFVKVDVEGAEGDVIHGAARLLVPQNFFLIEVHTAELFEAMPAVFAARGIDVHYISQSPHPLLGREHRAQANWWLVSHA